MKTNQTKKSTHRWLGLLNLVKNSSASYFHHCITLKVKRGFAYVREEASLWFPFNLGMNIVSREL